MESLSQDEILQILKIVEESTFDELYLEMGELKLILKKYRGSEPGRMTAHAEVSRDVPSAPVNANKTKAQERTPIDGNESQEEAPIEADQEEGYIRIRSPILGTFYRAPKPGAPPFVEEGQKVNADDTVCIIEVMKLFNTVKAGVQGRIAKVLVGDGEMVEYQQTLFLINETDRAAVVREGSAS